MLTEEEKERLTEENEKLIYYIANKRRPRNVDKEELISAAGLGFARALNSFDPEKGIKFQTFAAFCMTNEINRLFRYLMTEGRRGLTVSLDAAVYTADDGSEMSLLDMLPHPDKGVDRLEFDEIVEQVKRNLNDQESEVLRMYQEGITQKEIGHHLGISQNQVSRLLRRMRARVNAELWGFAR